MGVLSWFITTNKGKKEVSIPTSWSGVTLKQYIGLVTEWDQSDLLQLFSILSGIPVPTLNDTHDPALEESLIISTRFIYEDERTFLKAEKPETITAGGKVLKVPVNLKGLSIGQSIRVREALDATKYKVEDKYYYNYEKVMPIALANYFQPQFDGTGYNDDRAKELIHMFESLPVTEGWAVGFYLLKPLMMHGTSIGQQLRHQITKLLRASSKRELA